jgi:hypothetical protein
MWQWALMMGLRKFQEMVFTGRPFTAAEMADCHFVNKVVPRAQLEVETAKYATACSRTRPTDAVFMQKTFFEVMKQQQGEYMGSILTGWLESMLPMVKNDGALGVDGDTFGRGLNNAVKDNDQQFPPEWRMSMGARPRPNSGSDVAELRALIEAQQRQIAELTRLVTSTATAAE